jgi:NADP-dependent 3-hydroxy acid dehydrogenase YdfG
MTRRIWFITGAASGIGRELAFTVLGHRGRVALVAPHTDGLARIADTHPDRALALTADVRDEPAVRAAVDAALAKFGRIDVVASIAGDDAGVAQARAILDTTVGALDGLPDALAPLGIKVTVIQGERDSARIAQDVLAVAAA